jgi:hypothetical protein
MESIGLSLNKNKKKGKKNREMGYESPASEDRKPDVIMADVSGRLDRMRVLSSSGGNKVFNPFAASKRSA